MQWMATSCASSSARNLTRISRTGCERGTETMRRYTVAGARRRAARLLRGVARRLSPIPDPTAPESFPAGFRNWTARRSSKLFRGFPDNWDISEWREGRTARVAAVVHVHYPDLLPELVTQLAHIPVPFDLIVTNSSGSDITIDQTVLPHATRVITLPVDNHGRDILPLVAVVNSGLLDNYELVV